MPRAPLTSQQIEAFRARAVETAMALFASEGIERVMMRGLASALGCSPMTPYRYFANHADLFMQVQAEAFRRFADCLQKSYEPEGSGRDRLLRLKKAYIDFGIEQSNAYRIMFALQAPQMESSSELDEQSDRAFSYLHRATVQAVGDGDLEGDPLSLAHVLWANTHGLVMLHLAGKLVTRSLTELAAITLEL